jgi:uncharacterized protein (TIGR03437 family)
VPEPVVVASQQPAIFTVAGSGSGKGEIYVVSPDDGSLTLADEGRPVRPGDVLVIRATGLGQVNPPVREGDAAAENPPSKVVAMVKASVQGRDATVIEARLAPGEVGVYLVKVIAPDGLTTDASASVILQVGGQASPPVTIAIE